MLKALVRYVLVKRVYKCRGNFTYVYRHAWNSLNTYSVKKQSFAVCTKTGIVPAATLYIQGFYSSRVSGSLRIQLRLCARASGTFGFLFGESASAYRRLPVAHGVFNPRETLEISTFLVLGTCAHTARGNPPSRLFPPPHPIVPPPYRERRHTPVQFDRSL